MSEKFQKVTIWTFEHFEQSQNRKAKTTFFGGKMGEDAIFTRSVMV